MKGTTYRGDIANDGHSSTADLEGDDWVGEIISVPHPNSHQMGDALGKVTTVEMTTQKVPSRLERTVGSETHEVPILYAVDLITGTGYRILQGMTHPKASFARDGASYSLYAVEHKNGRGEWVKVTNSRSKIPWGWNKYMVKGIIEDYDGHEETRIVEKTVTHTRKQNADPTDTEAYTLSYETTPITVTKSNASDEQQQQTA